jgi:hypothetical protein
MTVYLLDANVFIQAKRQYYSFDICPGFWEALVWHAEQGDWCSIDRVRSELTVGRDDLAAWAKDSAHDSCFRSTDDGSVLQWYGTVMAWVDANNNFKPEAKYQFAQGADPWLVAYACAHQMRAITLEVPSPNVRSRVPIPNVCDALGVSWASTFDMLRDLGVSLGWAGL